MRPHLPQVDPVDGFHGIVDSKARSVPLPTLWNIPNFTVCALSAKPRYTNPFPPRLSKDFIENHIESNEQIKKSE